MLFVATPPRILPVTFSELGPFDWQQIHHVADHAMPALRDKIVELLLALATGATLTSLANVIPDGETLIAALLRMDFVIPALLREVRGTTEDVLFGAAKAAARHLPGDIGRRIRFEEPELRSSFDMRFDRSNPAAVAWVDQNAALLVREIEADTRLAIRRALQEGMSGEMTGKQVAQRIRNHIGLTERQQGYVDNYRRQLARDGVKPERIDTLTDQYHDRWVRYRASAIARTETTKASNEGQHELWRQATVNGLLDGAEFERVWILTRDGRTCSRCRALAGARAPIGGSFVGGIEGPPLHVMCRCAQGLRRVERAA